MEILFGADVIPWVPSWSSQREAAGVLKSHGGAASILRSLGAETRPLRFARAGDLVTLAEAGERVGRTALLVCVDVGKGLCSNRVEGVTLVKLRDLPQESIAHSLWVLNG